LFQAANSFGDGLDLWYKRPSGTTGFLGGICFGNGKFVGVRSSTSLSATNGVFFTSTNGSDWTQIGGSTGGYLAVSYGNGRFVAIGNQHMAISNDSSNWTDYSISPYGGIYWAITYAAGRFVAVGSAIYTSVGGTNWAYFRPSTNTLYSVAYGSGLFVAVGDAGTILSSTNGTNWSSVISGSTHQISSISYGNGGFVAFGASGVLTSIDGISWSTQSLLVANPALINAVQFGNRNFIAVEGHGAIISSIDGSAWKTRRLADNQLLAAVAYGNGSFVAVGNSGEILQSGPVFSLSLQRQPGDGSLEIALTGEIGRSYRIQVSTNLIDNIWADFATLTNTAETVLLDAGTTPSIPERYYRASSP